MNYFITIIFSVILSTTSSAFAQSSTGNDLTIKVSGIDSNDGKIFIGLYNSEDSFLNKTFKRAVSKIENNQCAVVLKDIPEGVYAISVFHDENDNNKMDKGMFGIPKEDYGCSNDATGFMGPPKWEDAKFEIKGKSISQHIKL
ncbi:DUF2141 domain-containing protein [Seonamhaeicola marinus]|uniref:DUF2141 domain-containing protein n=1 Tax=Seonamhaeicola marinus TaxID=1912246 RepID=A0A5D0IL11_9FLAO|nr:DUF2141 domain-containing protein [Seonamhaeicola marinus]TYA84254.1 DUF2141 domain-containing protein [Seonamhaeicola marinus]